MFVCLFVFFYVAFCLMPISAAGDKDYFKINVKWEFLKNNFLVRFLNIFKKNIIQIFCFEILLFLNHILIFYVQSIEPYLVN